MWTCLATAVNGIPRISKFYSFLAMRTLILTNCTNRKRSAGGDVAQFRDVQAVDLPKVVAEWTECLAVPREQAPAREVYCGRSFTEALSASIRVKAELRVVSAGLGLVPADTRIPNYSATISPGSEDSILTRMAEVSASSWWDALVDQSQFSKTTGPREFERIWVALSGPYLEMIKHTLKVWVSGGFEGLRIFCKPTVLPGELAPFALAYDDRLNDPSGPIPGTEGDFSQRALAHFSKVSDQDRLTNVEEDFVTVQSSLSGLTAPPKPNRQLKTDPEIRSIIRTEARTIGWNSSKMLRHLRDDLDIACEQKRFQRLFKAEMSGETAA
jgi:hypothetical protein